MKKKASRRSTQQHKPSRDGRHSKDIEELKAEIRQLRKQVTRLRKELQKAEEAPYLDEGYTVAETDTSPECKTCKSKNLKSMTFPTGTTLTVCGNCGQKHAVMKK